jgi:hypothetical protein
MSSTSGITFDAVWTAAGIVVAFAVSVFVFRIGRESTMRSQGGLWWLPRADFVLLGALAVTLIGVFVLPVLGAGLTFARYALGLAFVLLAGYPFALAGHYEILHGELPEEVKQKIEEEARAAARHGTPLPAEAMWQPDYFTGQERKALKVIGAACIIYLVAVAAVEVF